MISKITLTFQRHVKRTFRLKRVTTFTGDTDSGKSTVLRAIRWACLNQFDGPADSFIPWGKSFAKVKVYVDGKRIIRHKGNTNYYKLGEEDYRSFGAGKVPDAIAKHLKLFPANFQSQLDSHFWFSNTGGSISRELNQIVNLTSIDDAHSYLAQELRRTKAELTVSKNRVKAARERINDHLWVEGADRGLRKLETMAAQNARKSTKTARLRDAIDKARQVATRHRNAADAKLGALNAMRAGRKAKALETSVTALRGLIARLERAEALAGAELEPLPSIEAVQKRQLHINMLSIWIPQIQKKEKDLWRKRQELERLRKELDKVPKCKTCGQVILR